MVILGTLASAYGWLGSQSQTLHWPVADTRTALLIGGGILAGGLLLITAGTRKTG